MTEPLPQRNLADAQPDPDWVCTYTLAEIDTAAADLAARLAPVRCVLLVGALGAGKTTLARSLVQALGGDPEQVSSPTYVLHQVYPLDSLHPNQLHHLDLYRLQAGSAQALEALGLAELYASGAWMLVEWPDRLPTPPPGPFAVVQLAPQGPQTRQIRLFLYLD